MRNSPILSLKSRHTTARSQKAWSSSTGCLYTAASKHLSTKGEARISLHPLRIAYTFILAVMRLKSGNICKL